MCTLFSNNYLKKTPVIYINRYFRRLQSMAKSKYEYVKEFEIDDQLLKNCWLVVRIDGKGFHKFADIHNFDKPNDSRALHLMNKAATTVMKEFYDITLSYGQSDEYSFVFKRDTSLYNRRGSKIMSTVNSLFTSAYVLNWKKYFNEEELKYAPSFDSRIVLYPSDQNLRDYLSWRQADVHVNNLYNTAFWNLVLKGNLSNAEAEKRLRGSVSAEKNELLFSEFGINYNNEPAMYRKGTILLRKRMFDENLKKERQIIFPFCADMIKDKFWKTHSEILQMKPPLLLEDSDSNDLPELVKQQLAI